ncbi:hypothetical protein SLS55_002025 [Diplodia seriata]|uniref:Uncharacterized protein n=1 Tax=Diplodia seriata TaxID=420778 RepID=A0ABR3CR03_9PEZI
MTRLPVPTSTPTISPLLATKIRALLRTHGFAHPLQFSPLLPEPDGPDNHTIVAALAWAIFRSPSTPPRMTPAVAAKTIELFIAANGTSVGALRDSSPQLRNDILAAGGCGGKSAARRRYREDTAEALHALAVVLEERYDGVAYALLPETAEGDSHWDRRGWMEASRAEIEARQRACEAEMRERLAGFEGIEERGADAFVGLMQGVWPALAPYLEPGSARTARELGLAGGNAWTLFECVGRREWDMARLNAALARVREKGELGAFRERFASRRFDQTVDPKGPPVTTYGFDGWSWWVAE